MVLSLTNSGKYLSRSWARDRAEALNNPDGYEAAELAFLEVGLAPAPEAMIPKWIRDRPEAGR